MRRVIVGAVAAAPLNPEGSMYCSSSLGVGTKIMAFAVEASDAYSLVTAPAGDGVRVWDVLL